MSEPPRRSCMQCLTSSTMSRRHVVQRHASVHDLIDLDDWHPRQRASKSASPFRTFQPIFCISAESCTSPHAPQVYELSWTRSLTRRVPLLRMFPALPRAPRLARLGSLGQYAPRRIANRGTGPVAWLHGTAAVTLGDSAFIALVIFKEAQAFAARSMRKLVSRARAFLDLPSEQPQKHVDKAPSGSVPEGDVSVPSASANPHSSMVQLFGSGEDGASEGFLACRDHATKAGEREYLERAWQRVGHLVGDRRQHFLKEFRSNFYAKSWELYLLAVLSDAGCAIEPGKPEGPDICASIGGRRVWIEAVVPTPGAPQSADRVPQRPSGHRGVLHLYPEASLLLRYRSVLEEKLSKVDSYVNMGLIADDDSVLVAVNHGAIEDSDLHDLEVPAMVKAVFPMGEPVLVVVPYSKERPRVEIPPRFAITKKSGAEVSTTLFLEPRSGSVSGVLFASQLVWNLRKSAEKDLRLVHNPHAAAPFPRGAFPLRCEFWVEEGELRRQESAQAT